MSAQDLVSGEVLVWEEMGKPPSIAGYAAVGDAFLDVWRDTPAVPEEEGVVAAILLLV